LVFARVTAEMLRAAIDQARQEAKAQGKGFFGQWGAQLGSYATIGERYYQMPVEAILREHPDNFALPLQQVRRVDVKRGHMDEQGMDPDYLVIHAAQKLRFNLKGISAPEAKKALRQVLGEIVR
jgi:hypothetical protein